MWLRTQAHLRYSRHRQHLACEQTMRIEMNFAIWSVAEFPGTADSEYALPPQEELPAWAGWP